MVSATNSIILRGALLSVGLVATVSAACGKIVGIEDTTVVAQAGAGDGTGGSSGGKGGSGGTAGTSSAGRAAAGASSGGNAGTTTAAGGSSGKGGGAAGASAAGKGGTAGATAGGSAGVGGAGAAGKGGGGAGTGGTAGDGEGGAGMPGNGCTVDDTQCTDGVHMICTTTGWEPDPCPLNKPTCEGKDCIVRGPTMVKVNAYYIDSTEVTVAQYGEFTTAKNGDTSGQVDFCSWNDDYGPADLQGGDNLPVADVDWCDAAAYCDWAGKHLCGAIDRTPLAVTDVFDKDLSQWFLACGGGGFHPNTDWECNETDGNGNVAEVATFPKCEGYVSGLFDMEGNVAEWADVCDTALGADDACYPLGGSVQDSQSYCDEKYSSLTRRTTAYSVGFRCCAG